MLNKRTVKRRFENAVLVMAVEDSDHVEIFNPATGGNRLVTWSVEDLHERRPGEELRLVRRSGR